MWKVSKEYKGHSLVGCFLAWKGEKPCCITVESVNFLPVYSTVEKLEDSMELIGTTGYKIKQIQDTKEFVDSVAGHMRIALDPWITDRGTTRFTEIIPDNLN